MSKKDRQFWESTKLNNATYMMYYNRLVELATSLFEWKNLPKSIDERYLELTLFSSGHAVFFEDEVLGFLALNTTLGGNFDEYMVPNNRRAFSANGYNRKLTQYDSVILYNNYLRTNSMLDAELYARKLYEVDRAIDVNVKGQKTPIVIVCDENERLTMKNLYMKYDGNEPFIFGDKGLNTQGVKVLNTGVPFVSRELYDLKNMIWQEALMMLGIYTSKGKKERVLTSELESDNASVTAQQFSKLEMRRQACKKINEMFGLDIWCDYRIDLENPHERSVNDE